MVRSLINSVSAFVVADYIGLIGSTLSELDLNKFAFGGEGVGCFFGRVGFLFALGDSESFLARPKSASLM